MVSKRLSIFGFISAAALVSGVLIGCGGSSASTSAINPTVTTTGGVTTSTGNSSTSAPTSTSPQQVQVTTSSGTVTAVVPPGQPSITPSTTLAVIPAGTSFLNGLTPKFNHPATKGGKAQQTTPAGELFIGYSASGPWFDTGTSIGANAELDESMAFAAPATSFLPNYLMVGGPLTVSGTGINGAVLHINSGFILGFVVFADGSASLPGTLTLRIPADGGTLAGGNFANVTIPTEFIGLVDFIVSWPGETKTQAKVDTNGTVSIGVTGKGNSTDVLPPDGVDTVSLLIVSVGV